LFVFIAEAGNANTNKIAKISVSSSQLDIGKPYSLISTFSGNPENFGCRLSLDWKVVESIEFNFVWGSTSSYL
jgi:hypothetical protein